jgi:hypothetical protein
MDEGRASHTATLLPDGTVLVAGGNAYDPSRGSSIVTSSAELYEPGNGT